MRAQLIALGIAAGMCCLGLTKANATPQLVKTSPSRGTFLDPKLKGNLGNLVIREDYDPERSSSANFNFRTELIEQIGDAIIPRTICEHGNASELNPIFSVWTPNEINNALRATLSQFFYRKEIDSCIRGETYEGETLFRIRLKDHSEMTLKILRLDQLESFESLRISSDRKTAPLIVKPFSDFIMLNDISGEVTYVTRKALESLPFFSYLPLVSIREVYDETRGYALRKELAQQISNAIIPNYLTNQYGPYANDPIFASTDPGPIKKMLHETLEAILEEKKIVSFTEGTTVNGEHFYFVKLQDKTKIWIRILKLDEIQERNDFFDLKPYSDFIVFNLPSKKLSQQSHSSLEQSNFSDNFPLVSLRFENT